MFVLFLLFAAVSAGEVYFQGTLVPNNVVPTFDKGYIIAYKDHGVVVYTPDGSLAYNALAHVEGAPLSNMVNASVDTDGSLVAAIDYNSGGGIALFDRTGEQTDFFDTGDYLPTQICVSPDRSIWTLGGRRAGAGKEDYFVLRKYSLEGEELGAFLPRSSFASEGDPAQFIFGAWSLRIANGRVGARLFHSGPVTWVETDLQGKEIGRWNLGNRGLLAFTQSGRIYAQEHRAVEVFERSTHSWRAVAGMPDGTLLGADGDSLVFHLTGGSTVRRVPVSQ